MTRNKNIPGPRDIGYINLPSEDERHYWAREFGCSERELADAVASVGPLVIDVRSHLGRRLEEDGEAGQPAARKAA